MTGTDMVFMRQQADSDVGQVAAQWPGEWPPPDYLTTIGAPDGGLMVVPEGAQLTRWELVSASEIDEPARPDEHWFRGAQYVPVSAT